MQELAVENDAKIIVIVLDGLGGLPHPETALTELATAKTPNLDAFAKRSICGMADPVMPGITPGSAPGHLAIFGYDPMEYYLGRGVLEALGIDMELKPGDIAARGNYCTLDSAGAITDRRAGRLTTEQNIQLTAMLDGLRYDDIEVIVKPVKDHRFVAVFRGPGLSDKVTDSDPQKINASPLVVKPLMEQGAYTAGVVNRFIEYAMARLGGHTPANGLLLRGFSKKPSFPDFGEIYKLRSCAVASYPMYRGLAKVVGMNVANTGSTVEQQIDTLKQCFEQYDYFFLHYKPTDAAGEDGNFSTKVKALEVFDSLLPEIEALRPDVMVVTGDHSTPATFQGHSWHTVPVAICGKYCRPDSVSRFDENECNNGGLGRIPAHQIMAVAMANALKLTKYGA
jgi:2,3-bisphosphoglycerate-independent phosphoglycerate mutase